MRNLSLTLFLLMVAVMAYGQGVTTSSMNGLITDQEGTPLIGANVLAVHGPTGSPYGNSTNVEGYFRIPGMRVGGPYTVTISYTGYEDNVIEGVYLRLGQTYGLDVQLEETAINLGAVEVVAVRNDLFDGNRTGAQTVITEEQINTLPTVGRSIGEFTRLTPQTRVTEGNDGLELSFGGQNNRYNAIYIDGAVNNDVFGLAGSGVNGGQTGVSPISLDAIEEFQVNLAPFDVRLGGFAGAAVSAITRSGTNNFEGSVYTFWRNENLIREEFEGAMIEPFTAQTTGFRIGGPIVKDKLFFFLNGEIQREETPLPFNPDSYIGDASAADLAALVNKLNGFGYDPGTYTNNQRFLNSDKLTLKFDYNLNQANKFSLRFGYVNADNLEGVQSDFDDIRFLNGSERFVSDTYSAALEWNSLISNTLSNNLTIGLTAVRDDRDPNGDPFPYVNIADGSGEIIFGSERFSTANRLDQDVLTITDNLEFYSGKHTFTVGANAEFYRAANLFIPRNFGEYEFSSLQNFLLDSNSVAYERSFSLRDNIVGDESSAIAEFNAGQFGVYVQDEYQATPNLKLTLGVRLDLPFYADTPVNDPFNKETIPLLEEFYDLQGAQTGQFIDAVPLISPRFGFNWDVTGNKQTQLRGGVGIFTSRAPLVWVGGAYNNYGLNRGTFEAEGLPFNPDINTQPPGDIDPSNAVPSGDIDLFASDLQLPRFLRANLALDQKLFWGLTGTLDLMFTKTLQNVAYQNVNLKPAVDNLEGTPDDRPIFNRFDPIDPTYGRILLGYNTTEGYAYNISASVEKPFTKGLSGTLAYSFSDAYSVFDGTSSQNSSQWRGLHSINGRNFDQRNYRSNFAAGSRIIAGISYGVDYKFNEKIGGKTTVSIFHESAQTQPFSYIYNDRGNLQREDSRERALIYIPASENDIVLV
ncbi:MAG: carboxypeptidase regulatory-like domain-containing protein, partial [Bacteroidota bacterium]